ncbi:unnamed protein product [Citrullus colocynthis]|uniref:F-box associated beta-propeller type 1 domain-containing protein n=1 Tax=Citrullus colocynthis TaxID=252529 RepID=A0ABP0YRJ3_9ROSI
MYHEGTFYWWEKIQSFTQNTEHILTFDMSEEVFGKISVPESFDRQGNFRSLMVFNGSIVLFSYPYAGEIFDIWEMEKDEFAVVSWSKLLTIGPLCGIEFPLLFVNSDELLMESKEGQVVLYSIKAQQVKELPIKGENPHGWRTNRFEATFFIKSLLPVEGRNNINYEF